jgi:formamidopyrimidine-DNA glycosylase
VPELPDIAAYLIALEPRIVGETLDQVRLASAFLLRTTQPPIASVEGTRVNALKRVGKRIAIGLDNDLWLVLHLMIAGRLHWRKSGAKLAQRRASLHVLKGEEELRALDQGGLDIFASDLPAFRAVLTRENHTLKRALTDQRFLSGIGNAYSDEILHAAHLSPIALTHNLRPDEWERLFAAARETLRLWIDRLETEARADFPEGVTAFREGMAVHGRYGKPCPRCGDQILRIRYADKETNYCARCQTGGRVLADRSLSRLLGADWPRTLDELEALKRR